MEWYPLKGDGHALWGKPFFDDPQLDAELASISGALWRTEDGLRFLALPYAADRPFPLTALFCFARVCRMRGGEYVVYRVDGKGWPVMPSVNSQR